MSGQSRLYRFQSLIGTVQRHFYFLQFFLQLLNCHVSISHRYGSTGRIAFSLNTIWYLVSISHRYGSTKVTSMELTTAVCPKQFQSLIGTVQQQYLLRFLFSLYPIFLVFQPFSSKKSANLFIANSRKALILLAFLFLPKLAQRFTDFSTVFLLFSALFHAVFVLEALILLP